MFAQPRRRFISLALLSIATAAAHAQVRPDAGMMRYPDVSATQIVFAYANDLWLAPREGGLATPLSSPSGEEGFPRFSADGKSIAFVGNYDGNRDIYLIPVEGGTPFRVTHHPDNEWLQDWTPDGRLLFNSSMSAGYPGRIRQLFTVGPEGGLPQQLPVPYGATAAVSPDGTWLAYTPHSIDFRTWKRYRGGMQTDIWLFNLKTHESKLMTDWEGTDSLPMWHGDTVYYLSDQGPEHRGNIWKYETRGGNRAQVTKFADFDVKWPSIGPGPTGDGEIILQNGADLYLLDLKTEQSKPVKVAIPGDRPSIRPIRVNMGALQRSADLSNTGKRVAVEARGDVFSLPAHEGGTRNLSRSDSSHERMPAWSPDGKWIAYFSDASGEYELYVRAADGSDEPRALTEKSSTFYYNANWSPDSKRIAFSDKAGNLLIVNAEGGGLKLIDTDPWANQQGVRWSHDSDWLTYSKAGDNRMGAIWLYRVSSGEKHQVTAGMFDDNNPTFDRKGEFLYYSSLRDFSGPTYEDNGTTFVYSDVGVLLAVPLRKDVKSPLLPKNDEEEVKKDGATSQPATASGSAPASSAPASSAPADEKKPLVIDVDGFERRAIQLPVKRGNFFGLSVNSDGHLIYVRAPRRGSEEHTSLKILDLSADEKEEKTIVSDINGFTLSADGKKALVMQGGAMAVIDAKPDQKTDKKVPTDTMFETIDPRAEWRQILREAWRVERDFFYDPNMHGVDWEAVYRRYRAMLDDCVSREDVSFLIREMISELNVGHAYYGGGDEEDQPNVSVGMLGCAFTLDSGAYRIAKIHEGAPWDSDARGPLSQPGVNVKEGDYLLAVNGAPLDTKKDPWAGFIGLAGKTVTITVSDKPTRDSTAREAVVKLLGGDGDLRYRAWIERNRSYVAEKSGGKVGYIYVPDTGINGQNNLFRQFYGQIDRQALIIDERWNGGGQIPTRFIELLNRPVTNYWARRDGKDWTWPPDSHQGPKCMLINGLAGSGGDMFPWLFKFNKLGKLIGTRTWGGLVGISGNPDLIDGGSVTAPTFAFYEKDGTWGVEGHGVDPDIELIDDPAKMVSADGSVKDPQLDAAIELMLKEIKANGYQPPKRPAYPDRKGMGIRPEDK
ncbi:MAG: Tricorn protease [Phycisphaerae bacterium]|nr:Tricorn protease [Phycisphaerae bacterium]